MPAPTKNDWNSFYSESFENKVNVLFYYLCEGGYNMQEIAEQVLCDYNQHGPQRVSLITRCYGFGGNNGGVFRSIGASRADVAAFVRAYPNGCEYDGRGRVMRDYLLRRVQSGNRYAGVGSPYVEQEYGSGVSGGKKKMSGRTKLNIALVVILFCVCKFYFDWNWVVSIIGSVLGSAVLKTLLARVFSFD